MKIAAIRAFRVELPLSEGPYVWADGRSVEVFDSTVVAVESDEGLTGWGECCPLGPNYLPAFAEGVRAGIRQLAPALLGLDPRGPEVVARRMDAALKGHPYAKSALDVACRDLLARACGLPLFQLLGGRFRDSAPLYRAISQDTPERMAARVARHREEGYRIFQLKVGGEPADDLRRIDAVREVLGPDDLLIADANTGWSQHEAARMVCALEEREVYVEQPCATYRECLAVRRRTRRPFVLDEVIDSMEVLVRGIAEGAMDAVNLKVSRLGGLGPLLRYRGLCADSGIAMIVEDSWGGDIVTATLAHLAVSTPPEVFLATTDFNAYVETRLAPGAPRGVDGRLSPPEGPGLGVDPDPAVLGTPVIEMHRS